MLSQEYHPLIRVLLVKQVKHRIEFTVYHLEIVVLDIGNQILDVSVFRLLISWCHQAQLVLCCGDCHIQQIGISEEIRDLIVYCRDRFGTTTLNCEQGQTADQSQTSDRRYPSDDDRQSNQFCQGHQRITAGHLRQQNQLVQRYPTLSEPKKPVQKERASFLTTQAARFATAYENLTKEALKLEKQREKHKAGLSR